MSSFTIIFEAGLAVLMIILIVYCVILNRRLGAIRAQQSEIKEMTAAFEAASQRAESSVAGLKAAGLAAEKSLRAAILEAEDVRASLPRAAPAFSPAFEENTRKNDASPTDQNFFQRNFDVAQMVPGADVAETGNAPLGAEQSGDRKQAELAVLEAIRSARSEA